MTVPDDTSQAKVVLELGMFTGTTTVSLAMVPSVEKVVTLELEGYLERRNRPYFEQSGVSDKIDIRIGNALTSLDRLIKENALFDMASPSCYIYWLRTIFIYTPGIHRRRQGELHPLLPQDYGRWFTCQGGIHSGRQRCL